MQMSITVGMPGISHSSSTKKQALAMLHHPQKGLDSMWDMSEEGGHQTPEDTELIWLCCGITFRCIISKEKKTLVH